MNDLHALRDLDTEIFPPDPDDDGGGDEPEHDIHASICEPDGTHRGCHITIPGGDAGPPQVAAALLDVARGVAACRGQDTYAALDRLLRRTT